MDGLDKPARTVLMATKKQQEELIQTLKFTPRTYNIYIGGYGGEAYAGTVDKATYEYFKEKKIDIGMKMKITTLKNREFRENQTVYLDLRYDSGINPYSGLLDFAIRSGVIENKSKGYLVTATGKTVYDKDLYTSEIFNKEALEKINDWLSKNGYSSTSEIFSSDVAESIRNIGVTDEDEGTKKK
jgi:hypothetical protein